MNWIIAVIIVFAASQMCWSETTSSALTIYDYSAAHSQGNIQLTVLPCRWGNTTVWDGETVPYVDPITNDSVWGCEYPRGSRNIFMNMALKVGAVMGADTLITLFFSRVAMNYPTIWTIRSTDKSKAYYSPKARSDLDLECAFQDTLAYDRITFVMPPWEGERHNPLGVVGTQRSMAWSGAMIDDFVMFEVEMTNMGHDALTDLYVGIWCQSHAWFDKPGRGDLTGFLRGYRSLDKCDAFDTLNIAYNMDNTGQSRYGQFGPQSRRGAVGIMLLGSSADSLRMGYNWCFWDAAWDEDWGPRRRPSEFEPWRSYNPYFAWPGKDINLYHLLSHPHIAYDQLFAAIDHQNDGWMPPGRWSETAALGWPTEMFYYFGPFEIGVKEHISFTLAVVGGDNVHNDPYAQIIPHSPQQFYDQLDFSELATNARWAQWVYDNPGVDTDSDGYFGEFRICEGDTIWYKGDGVPDYRGNTPPPAPFTRFITEPGRITIRWNGYLCETTKDPFSGLIDFEGYRVYCGLDTRRSHLSLLTTYDRENFFRLKYHELGAGYGKWLNDEPPYTLDSLRIIHDDPAFDPLRYTLSYPLFEGDSAFYFQPVDANLADLSSMRDIHKVYPDATDPGTDTTLWTEDDITHDYGCPLPKYYEYEYIHDNLMPTVPYFVAVTSFDFGYAGGRGNLPPDESNPLNNLTECYAQTSADTVETYDLDVYVYPNPYRVDADYHTRGYENRAGHIIPNRARVLHFGNLPNVCKISIFSLDGDLIGTIDHNHPEGGPEAMHDWWNLVSRSGLAVESGLYYWVVESATRSQIGKFVILK